MLISRRQLHMLSRNPAVLTRAVLVVLAVFFLNALVISVMRRGQPPGEVEEILSRGKESVEDLKRVLGADPPDRMAILRLLREEAAGEYQGVLRRQGRTEDSPPESDPGALAEDLAAALRPAVSTLLEISPLPAREKKDLGDWHAALAKGEVAPELIRYFENLVWPEAPALPRLMAGDLKRAVRDYQGALADYEAAAEHAGGEEARRRAVDLALSRDWGETTARLMGAKAYQEAVYADSGPLARRAARQQLDFTVIFRQMADHSIAVAMARPGLLLLSLLTAAVWFVSLHKACRLPLRQWWTGLAAVPLGVFSTVLTLVLLSLQEARGGLTDSAVAGPALVFQVASVGLREEFSKLLCALPLLLWLLVRNGTPAQALMVASCTGLGFALEENTSYYAGAEGAVITRFVTANFLHIGMTGLSGLALFKFMRWPRNFGTAFIGTFTGMVLLHGFYNFSQGSYGDRITLELPPLVPFMIAGLAWFYFQALRQEQEGSPQALSASAVFLLGTATVLGVLLNYLVWEAGWKPALQHFVPAALSSVLFCWLFVRFLREA